MIERAVEGSLFLEVFNVGCFTARPHALKARNASVYPKCVIPASFFPRRNKIQSLTRKMANISPCFPLNLELPYIIL